jgi:protease secretion system outer membrane protein
MMHTGWRPSTFALWLALLGTGSSANAVDLMRSFALARQQEPNFRAAMASAEANREAVPQAVSQLLPSLSFSGARNKVNLDQSVNNFNSTFDYFSSNYSMVLRQPLYRRSQLAQYDQALAQVKAADEDEQRAGFDLLQRVAGAYFEALFAQDVSVFMQSLRAATEGQLRAAQRNFELGQGTRTDIDEAQARLDMAMSQVLQASQQVHYTRQQLQALINEDVGDLAVLDIARFAPQQLQQPLDHWLNLAQDRNPELRMAQARVEAARQEIIKAQSGHLPTLDLVAQRTLSRSENVLNPVASYFSTQAGVQLNVPLYSGGYVDSSIRQASASLQREEQMLEQTRRSLSLQVRKEYQNLTEGLMRMKALEQAVRSAEQLVLSSQKGVQAGTRTQTDVLNAIQRRAESLRDLAQARYQYLIAELRLRSLTGDVPEEIAQGTNQVLRPGAP